MKEVGAWLFVIALFVLAIWGITEGSYQLYAHYQPKYVQVQNKTFHESQQRTDAQVSNLQHYEDSYVAGGKDERAAIRSIVRQQYGGDSCASLYLPSDSSTCAFLNKMKEDSL